MPTIKTLAGNTITQGVIWCKDSAAEFKARVGRWHNYDNSAKFHVQFFYEEDSALCFARVRPIATDLKTVVYVDCSAVEEGMMKVWGMARGIIAIPAVSDVGAEAMYHQLDEEVTDAELAGNESEDAD